MGANTKPETADAIRQRQAAHRAIQAAKAAEAAKVRSAATRPEDAAKARALDAEAADFGMLADRLDAEIAAAEEREEKAWLDAVWARATLRQCEVERAAREAFNVGVAMAKALKALKKLNAEHEADNDTLYENGRARIGNGESMARRRGKSLVDEVTIPGWAERDPPLWPEAF